MNSCSKDYHHWIPFFEDLLFSNATSDVIILTLNRLTKKENVPEIIKIVAKSMLTLLKNMWNLKFENIIKIGTSNFQNFSLNDGLRSAGSIIYILNKI